MGHCIYLVHGARVCFRFSITDLKPVRRTLEVDTPEGSR